MQNKENQLSKLDYQLTRKKGKDTKKEDTKYSQMNRRSIDQQSEMQQQLPAASPSSIQPSQRKTQQSRFGGNKAYQGCNGATAAPAEHQVESLMSNRRRMKESLSHANLNNTSLSTKAKVPRLNLNLNMSSSQKKLIAKHTQNQSMESLPSGRLDKNVIGQEEATTPVPVLLFSPTSSSHNSNFISRQQQPQHQLNKQTPDKIQQKPVQFTPVRPQASKGQPFQQSKQQLVTVTTAFNHPSQNQHHSQSVEADQIYQQNSFRGELLPPGFANRSIEQEQRGIGRTPCQDSNEYEEIDDEMEFEDTMLSGGGDDMDDLEGHNRQKQRNNQRDEILDSSYGDMTAQSASDLVSFTNESDSAKNNQQRVPREDRQRRKRMLQGTGGSDAIAEMTSAAQQTLTSLVEDVSKNASQRVEDIVNERILNRRSNSRSSRKSRQRGPNQNQEGFSSSKQQPQGEQKPTTGPPSAVANNANAFLVRKSSSNSQYQSSLIHQYPKFDIDLSNYTKEQQQLINSESKMVTAIRQYPNEGAQSDVRVNKFGGTTTKVTAGTTSQTRGISGRGRRISETRSNGTHSISRRNQENGNASESLNRLVQNSVQNLSKILQRPSTNLDRNKFTSENGCFSSNEASFEHPRGQGSHRQYMVQPIAQDEHPCQIYEDEQPRTQTRSNTATMIQHSDSNFSATPEPLYYSNTLHPQRCSPEPFPQSIQSNPTQKQQQNQAAKPRWNATSSGVKISIAATIVPSVKSPRAQTNKQQQFLNQKSPQLSASKHSDKVSGKLDLSMIAENIEAKKTYMTLTATAVARKEAITVELQQRKQSHSTAPVAPKGPQALIRQSSAKQGQGARNVATATMTIRKQPYELTGAMNKAAVRIQRYARVFLQWRRLHLLATMRAMVYAMAQGYRVRKFLAQPSIKTMTKEITLSVRRENRQPANYMKEQSRKKTKASITQLIAACDAYPNNPVESPTNPLLLVNNRSQISTSTKAQPAESINKEVHVASTTQNVNNTSNLFKKRDLTNSRYRQAITPVKNSSQTTTMMESQTASKTPQEAKDGPSRSAAASRQIRAQTARQSSLMNHKTVNQTPTQTAEKNSSMAYPPSKDIHQLSSSRNNMTTSGTASVRPDGQQSTLYKATKSYQMKIQQNAATASQNQQQIQKQNSCTADKKTQPQQPLAAQTQISHRTGKSMQESRSSITLHKTTNLGNAVTVAKQATPVARQSSIQRNTKITSSTPAGIVHRSKSKTNRLQIQPLNTDPITTTILSPKGASTTGGRRVSLKQQNQQTTATSAAQKQQPTPGTVSKVDQGTLNQRKPSTLIQSSYNLAHASVLSQRKSPAPQRNDPHNLAQSSHRTQKIIANTASKQQSLIKPETTAAVTVKREKSRNRLARSPSKNRTVNSHIQEGDRLVSKKMSMSSENISAAKSALGGSNTIPRKPQLPPEARANHTSLQITSVNKPSQKQLSSSGAIASSKPSTTSSKAGATKVVAASLNSSFHRITTSEKVQVDLSTPVRQSRQQRQQQRTQATSKPAGGPETVQLSLLDLDISNPLTTSSTSVPNCYKIQKSKPTSIPMLVKQENFPVAVSIHDLLQEMNSHAVSLQKSPQKVIHSSKPQQPAAPQETLLDFQAAKRLQLERLIIDLRRDFEMSCLEQRSCLPSTNVEKMNNNK